MRPQGQYQPYQSYQQPNTSTTSGLQPHHRSLLITIVLALVSILIPVIGHLILTVYILRDDLSTFEKVAWLVIIWLVWWVGPLIYLVVGQRRNRLFGGHALFERHYQATQYPRD